MCVFHYKLILYHIIKSPFVRWGFFIWGRKVGGSYRESVKLLLKREWFDSIRPHEKLEVRKADVLICLENSDDGEICCMGLTPMTSSKIARCQNWYWSSLLSCGRKGLRVRVPVSLQHCRKSILYLRQR